jgi:hypothetical protein
MSTLTFISNAYTQECINVAVNTKNYRDSLDLSVINPRLFPARNASDTNCSYKAFIVAFMYIYSKTYSVGFYPPKQFYKYANNFFYYLSYLILPIHELSTEVPNSSCICYCMEEHINDSTIPHSFQHAFLMISYRDYFVIYDTWDSIRSSWVRATLKEDVNEIINRLQNSYLQGEDFTLLKYFFKIPKSSGILRFGFFKLFFLPFNSPLLQRAYNNSIDGPFMLDKGGKPRKTKRLKKTNILLA